MTLKHLLPAMLGPFVDQSPLADPFQIPIALFGEADPGPDPNMICEIVGVAGIPMNEDDGDSFGYNWFTPGSTPNYPQFGEFVSISPDDFFAPLRPFPQNHSGYLISSSGEYAGNQYRTISVGIYVEESKVEVDQPATARFYVDGTKIAEASSTFYASAEDTLTFRGNFFEFPSEGGSIVAENDEVTVRVWKTPAE
ncbi:MAG TPA: hypothetical protein PK861_01445 [Thermomonas sp.]|nr:hypothetical protein [Thermomonas sp.]